MITIYLSEYKANLDKYMKIAQVVDVKIISEGYDKTWILTSPKPERWMERLVPRRHPRVAVS